MEKPDNRKPLAGTKADASRTPGPVSVRLLGAFQVRCGDQSVQLPLTAQRVVALLALQDRALSRTQLAGILWADSCEERAAASLRSALWRLGTSGRALVRATPRTVLLAPEVRVDHQDAVARAHGLLGWTSGPAPAQNGLEEQAWRWLSGELLPGWYEDWVIIERERFNQLRLHALEALCASLAARRRFGLAVEAGHAAVAADPLRESAHRCLAQAYLAEGNVCDARHQYDFYRKLCQNELGCEPSAAFRQLVSAATD